ncbi:MAG: cell division protein FtsL [Cypionkella sp.]|uniref:cell division protein FtsL n=1 Tax=Cypionkella sp. TaxID=2811411 RepID=UPI002ABAA9DA|nr:cell division protein FtsL [Cypionkella sp.]MDZ4309370.1 cell division protein FtsL [Cypionkella sp.]
MRPVLYVLSFLAVMALGFWAYRENYATQAALRDVTDIQNEIAGLRESLSIERAEWAYLNRPDRLRDLGTLNFDRLGLLPMQPQQFGTAGQIAFPPAPLITNLPLDGTEMVSGTLDAEGAQTP